jgi:microtubule-associated protein-like 6
VNALYSCNYGILSGGKDRRVRLWTMRLEPGATFDCSSLGYLPSIRSVCMSIDGTSIVIGTKGSNIYEVKLATYDGSSWCIS